MSTIYENMCDVGSVDHESSLTPPHPFFPKRKRKILQLQAHIGLEQYSLSVISSLESWKNIFWTLS